MERLLIALLFCSACPCLIAEEPQHTADLSQLSLEELTKVEVSSFARKEHELFQTPAAVFVITHEDIRRSGISNLPELLRMVPGMQVAQLYANEWAVSSRGFNGRFADKMLVLIDGRSVYSEIYSGVYWDQNDLLLEDIDRIEVIRGPGGTLWGANAVNGIINIITLKSSQTKGALFVEDIGRLGTVAAARYGGSIGQQLQYRTYGKFLRRNELVTETGSAAGDAGSTGRLGARLDWQPRETDSLSVGGDIYRGRGKERINVGGSSGISSSKVGTSGGHVLARWEHTLANSDMALQTCYDQQGHSELSGDGKESTFDLDFITHLPRYRRNDPSFGVGYRLTKDHIVSNPTIFAHPRHTDILTSFFFEDSFALVPDEVAVTGGFKLIHNSYTGVEIQPGLRAIWTPDQRHALWAAVSRAVRTPSLQDTDIYFLAPVANAGPVPTNILVEGNPAFQSEIVHAYEIGYRQTLGKRLSLDAAGFFNKYSRLRSKSQLDPYLIISPSAEIIVPVVYGNALNARSDGVEAALTWTPVRSLQMAASYAWINANLRFNTSSPGVTGDSWATPTNTLNLRGTWEFAHHWSLYSSLYTVSQLPYERSSDVHIPAYVRGDVHLTFEIKDHLQVIVGGNNLQRSRHVEFNASSDGYSIASQVPRSAFVKAVWSF